MTTPTRTISRSLWTAGKVSLVLGVVGAAVYWFRFAPISVERYSVSSGVVVAEVLGTGTLEAHIQVSVSTKISGRLVVVDVDQGDTVEVDQVVARLDDHDLIHEVEIEVANVNARKAGVERLQADISNAKAIVEFAAASEARLKKLTGGASREEIDKSVEALAVSRAGLSRAESALAEGRKQLVAAEKVLEFRQARLDDAVIRAPFAGVVIRRNRNAGDVVVPGSAILAIVSTNELWVGAWVDETQLARLKPNQPARIVFRSEPDRSSSGRVVRLGRETDREARETRVDVAPLKLPTNWSVGQRAEVYIETDRTNAQAVLPLRLLVHQEGRVGAFVDVEGRVKWRDLTLGLRSGDVVEVREGLKPGEIVLGPIGENKAALVAGRRVMQP